VSPFTLIGAGLLLALSSGFLGFITSGTPYMTSSWQGELWLPIVGNTKFGTPFYFDTGVFLVVIGVVSKVFLLLEAELWK
jgi:multicomponent Na+:H+ antiporter subunit B